VLLEGAHERGRARRSADRGNLTPFAELAGGGEACPESKGDGDGHDDRTLPKDDEELSRVGGRALHQLGQRRDDRVVVEREHVREHLDVRRTQRDARALAVAERPDQVEIRGEDVVHPVVVAVEPPGCAARANHSEREVELERTAGWRERLQVDLVEVGEQPRQGVPGGECAALEPSEVAGGEPSVGSVGELAHRQLALAPGRAQRPRETPRPGFRVECDPGCELDCRLRHRLNIARPRD
jgi:hypothetical protein